MGVVGRVERRKATVFHAARGWACGNRGSEVDAAFGALELRTTIAIAGGCRIGVGAVHEKLAGRSACATKKQLQKVRLWRLRL